MNETKRPEFKLHKKPPLGKSGPYCVRKDEDGSISVHMGDYVILEGMTEQEVSDIASLMLSSCRTSLGLSDVRLQALNRPVCACQAGGWGLAGPPNTLRGIFG